MEKTQILVVEDDVASARLIEMTLKSLGYAVPTVISSGEEAINKAGEVHPDLVLMDIRLKGDVDGVQAAEEICARFNIPVVYLTAYADNDTLQRAKITEPYGYILKPFQKRELDASIEIALYKHKLDSKLKEKEQALEKLTAELKTNNEHLQREVTERKKLEAELKERHKELQCLYEIARIAGRPGITSNEIYQEVVNILPRGWHYPEVACARITIDNNVFQTANCRDTGWKQSADIKAHGMKVGMVKVGYLEEKPTTDEGPFLKEERALINAVAERLGRITERVQAEEALQQSEKNLKAYLESAPDGVYLNDLKGVFLYGNKKAEEIMEYTREELIGKSFLKLNLLPARNLAKAGKLLALNAMGKPTGPDEFELIRRDGSHVWVEINTTPIRHGGKIVVLGFVRDITERKKAQQAQESLSQQLQTKVSELEALSYGIAHDLRSPLLSIEGFSRLLQDDIQNQKMERVQEDIRLLESGVKKMQQFINRTLEYSRAGHLVKPAKNIPFDKIAKEVVAEFAEQVHSIGATVSLADTFPRVYADRMRIKEVLTNLIQNSINYRDKARPLKIEIGYRLSEHEVGFFVRDNGIGIDASETEKVFALFYRGATDSEGSGAGLAIAKRIIEAHGGRIWAESQSEKGTTLCFTLPRQSSTKTGDNNEKN